MCTRFALGSLMCYASFLSRAVSPIPMASHVMEQRAQANNSTPIVENALPIRPNAAILKHD
jgi:hypothetical protein